MPDRIGHYRVHAKLGEGGMGVVYAATDERLDRAVALKMVRDSGRDHPSRERLWREARAAASVSHPNVCQLYEVGEENGDVFIAMELLEGEPVSARLARGPIPLAESGEITLATLAALRAIHARGLVHRDLKPSNIFLTAHGVKLLDFGLARPVHESDTATHAALTMPGTVAGTPQYMSPEQLAGEALDTRCDLFAVGSILFELLVGAAAFGGKTTAQLFHNVMYEPVPSLGGSPALAAVDRVIHRATAKRPGDRYADATSMSEDLRAALALADSGEVPAARCLRRVVVLPFRLLRPDTEIDFLSFSLADAITGALGTLESLVVRSSLAGAKFRGDSPDLTALAKELDVDAAVSGTLLRAGSQVRVAAQLVEAPGGRVLWSKTAQVMLNDVFQLQDDLTRQIVESLSLPLSSREQRLLSHDAPASARSYEYYLRANELAADPKSWTIARDLYSQAVTDDPCYAPAWARFGRVLRVIGKLGGGTAADLVQADAAVKRALELNPELPLAHNLAAQMDIDRGHARDAMVRLLAQASRHSTDPELFSGLVYACRYCGLLTASLRADEGARRLDPSINTSGIHTLFMLGEHERVLTYRTFGPIVLAFSFMALGRDREALEWLDGQDPKMPARIRSMIAGLRALLQGHRAESIAIVEAVTAGDVPDAEALYYLARQLSRAGAEEQAIATLDRAIRRGFYCYPVLVTDSWLDPLRERPAFATALEAARQAHEAARQAFREAGGERILGVDEHHV